MKTLKHISQKPILRKILRNNTKTKAHFLLEFIFVLQMLPPPNTIRARNGLPDSARKTNQFKSLINIHN